jgi:soluble lytic murein transglycosylase-like protein
MKNLRGTYVHRGDGPRTRRRFKKALFITASLVAAAVIADSRDPELALASSAPTFSIAIGDSRLREELASARGELDLANGQLQRMTRVFAYSSRYGIGADLAGAIYDVALAEGIDPELGFRLVEVESQFNERATSPVGAVGLAQVMVSTARFFRKDITREQLYDRETNLRIGFRYLRSLIRAHEGDLKLALLVYNRGPVAVGNALTQGRDPANGYDRAILTGYTGSGFVD